MEFSVWNLLHMSVPFLAEYSKSCSIECSTADVKCSKSVWIVKCHGKAFSSRLHVSHYKYQLPFQTDLFLFYYDFKGHLIRLRLLKMSASWTHATHLFVMRYYCSAAFSRLPFLVFIIWDIWSFALRLSKLSAVTGMLGWSKILIVVTFIEQIKHIL